MDGVQFQLVSLFLAGFFVILVLLVLVLIAANRDGAGDVWVDADKSNKGLGWPQLVNYAELDADSCYPEDAPYNPRGNADQQDSTELDTRRRERIRSVVAGSLTLESNLHTKTAVPSTRSMPWPAPEHQRNVDIDEKRKTRLRQLLRDTQSES